MRERMKKLKQKKGKLDILQKVCKNCGKDYIEKDNFKWSCRTHRSDYSGEIYWCCGKPGKDTPGCKYSQHESKEEEEDEEADSGNVSKQVKNIRCFCCKEIGHTIDSCPRDPNIRTNEPSEEDFMRIQKMKEYRKLNADTVVTTTHFLKKCILVPTRQEEREEEALQKHPFKRGVMKFDDFNYEVYNPYILVQEVKQNKTGKGGSQSQTDGAGTSTELNGLDKGGVQQDGLSVAALEAQGLGKYEFEHLSLNTKSEVKAEESHEHEEPEEIEQPKDPSKNLEEIDEDYDKRGVLSVKSKKAAASVRFFNGEEEEEKEKKEGEGEEEKEKEGDQSERQ